MRSTNHIRSHPLRPITVGLVTRPGTSNHLGIASKPGNSPAVLRFIELGFVLLAVFLVVAAVAFALLRPTLKDVRSEVQNDWRTFLTEVRQRNDLILGLLESLRGFEADHSRLSEKLLEARAISTRSNDPNTIVRAVDQTEEYLERIEKLARSNPELRRYPPFDDYWARIVRSSQRVALVRVSYNSSARLYNRLLALFPQNLFTSLFGFVPVNYYPMSRTIGDE